MWRHLTRGLQQGFKRGNCFEKSDNCVKDGKTTVHTKKCCLKELFPTAFESSSLVLKQGDGDQYQRKYRYSDKSSRNISQCTLFEVFGWSGALVFGWTISKQLWLKQICTRDNNIDVNKDIVFNKSFIKLLLLIVQTQPPVSCVLPQLQSTSLIKTTKDSKAKIPPDIKLEDEFESAAKELQKIHEKAVGEALNRRGIACLSNSTNSEAILYFKRASEFKYPPASFNMGQCYELGIGTEQDFKKAADWYRIASDQGHATAMYNLGVFYAHGWGGLQADIIDAKKLFVKAAKLGQLDAKAALDKECKFTSSLSYKTNHAQYQFLNSKETNPAHIKSPEFNVFVNNTQNGLVDDVFHTGFGPERNWNVPFQKCSSILV